MRPRLRCSPSARDEAKAEAARWRYGRPRFSDYAVGEYARTAGDDHGPGRLQGRLGGPLDRPRGARRAGADRRLRGRHDGCHRGASKGRCDRAVNPRPSPSPRRPFWRLRDAAGAKVSTPPSASSSSWGDPEHGLRPRDGSLRTRPRSPRTRYSPPHGRLSRPGPTTRGYDLASRLGALSARAVYDDATTAITTALGERCRGPTSGLPSGRDRARLGPNNRRQGRPGACARSGSRPRCRPSARRGDATARRLASASIAPGAGAAGLFRTRRVVDSRPQALDDAGTWMHICS